MHVSYVLRTHASNLNDRISIPLFADAAIDIGVLSGALSASLIAAFTAFALPASCFRLSRG